jgi:hypothetical protein
MNSRESTVVTMAVAEYINSVQSKKTQAQIMAAIELVHEMNYRPLKLGELAGISKVQRHLDKINTRAEEALRNVRRKAN